MDKSTLNTVRVLFLYRLFGIVGVKEQDVTGRDRVKKRRRKTERRFLKMDELKKLLSSFGLATEQIEQAMGVVKEIYKDYIPKYRFDEVNEAKKQLEAQLQERDKQLAELKKAVGENEELRKQIEELQKANKMQAEEYKTKIRDMAVTTAIKLTVAGQAHDPDLIATLLDKSKIELDDNGNIKGGLEDQLKVLKEQKPFLFISEEPKNQTTTISFKGTTPADGSGKQLDNLEQIRQVIRQNLGF